MSNVAMAEKSAREMEARRIFDAVGAFLFEHRLDPTPANYLLVHALVTESSPLAVAAIRQATSDGMRLTQREADRIMEEFWFHAGGDGGGAVADRTLETAQHQVERFTGMVEKARADAEDYGRDLAHSAAQLAEIPQIDGLAELIRLTSAMIARTRAAEKRLETATGEAQALRQKLVSLKEEALSDPLTGLPNRRAFDEHFAELTAAGVPITVALCDIDRFKTVNDSHGHAVGDRVLKIVAQLLDENCQDHMVARYGGEEFAILFTRIGPDAAARIVGDARDAVAARHFKVRDTDAPIGTITFSAGIASAREGEAEEAVLKRADALLYRAKRNGRDRTEIDTGPDAPAAALKRTAQG